MKFLVIFYQKYISLLFGSNKCRYYPTCSSYALWNLELNGYLKSLFYIIKRVLTCNQLFKGGINYPEADIKIDNIYSIDDIKSVKYWLVQNETKYIAIKNLEREDK